MKEGDDSLLVAEGDLPEERPISDAELSGKVMSTSAAIDGCEIFYSITQSHLDGCLLNGRLFELAVAHAAASGRPPPPAASPVSQIDAETAAVLASLTEYSSEKLSRKMVPFMDIQAQKGIDVFCVRWSPDGQFLACGTAEGTIRVFNSKGQQAYELNSPPNGGLPTTCIRFRPFNLASKTKNVLISASTFA